MPGWKEQRFPGARATQAVPLQPREGRGSRDGAAAPAGAWAEQGMCPEGALSCAEPVLGLEQLVQSLRDPSMVEEPQARAGEEEEEEQRHRMMD